MISSVRIQSYPTRIVIFTLTLLLTIASSLPANAAFVRNIGSNDRYAALVVDADTGTVLHHENADKLRYPASLTKMMTLYLTFEALKSGQLKMDQMLPVSAHAQSQPRMNMGFHRGEMISVRDTILSIIVRSANDSAVVLAEAVGGNESTFVNKMNARAASLGMDNTNFRNPSGLPDSAQHTTAYDLAKLAIALRRDFPEYYPLFSRTNFTYRNHVWEGHNHLTSSYPGADGLKTGFVNASGFNLVTSAKRGNTKLVGVVMGGDTARLRDHRMASLLDYYFQKLSGGVVSAAYADEGPAMPPRKGHIRRLHHSKKHHLSSQQASQQKKHFASTPKNPAS